MEKGEIWEWFDEMEIIVKEKVNYDVKDDDL